MSSAPRPESPPESPPDNPLRVGLPADRAAPPCAVVIFGASGDLTKRKLVPALYNLMVSQLLSNGCAIVGVARRDLGDFAAGLRADVGRFSRRPVDEALFGELSRRTSYVIGDFTDPSTFERLRQELLRVDAAHGTAGSRVYYLAVAPDQVPGIVHELGQAGLIERPEPGGPFQRVVIEKPFGDDLASARALNRQLEGDLAESQTYRIDHYLGKETVQNLLVLRFGNAIFEPLWSRQHVERVEITVAEDIGVEGRGRFYDRTGITRDIVQNHALQLLTLVAMEPPSAWDADAIRDEKVKVLRALRPIRGREVLDKTVRGQYGRGVVRGDEVVAYREEPGVREGSVTETFVALSTGVDNFRWGGVPFLLRAGKRLRRRAVEVVLHFRPVPHRLFADAPEHNQLVLRIQPDEGVSLRFGAKVPGGGLAVRGVAMDFFFGAAFGSSSPEAYERLLLDVMRGDATLFTRADEVEAEWAFVDPILRGWQEHEAAVADYASGGWGPAEADALVPDGVGWRRP